MENSSQTKFSLADQVRIFKGIIGFGKPYWLPFALSFVATAIVAAISAYLPIIIQRYLDEVLGTNSATLQVTIQVAAFYFGLTLLKVAVYYFRDFTFKLTAEKQ